MSVSILEIVTRCMIISEMRRSRLCHFPRTTRVEYIPTGLRWYNLKQTIVSYRHDEFTYTYLQVRKWGLYNVPGSIRCSWAHVCPTWGWSVREVLVWLVKIDLSCDLSWYRPHLSSQSGYLRETAVITTGNFWKCNYVLSDCQNE